MRMFFLIGAGRSGTTLLSNMLNMHGQIISPPEHDFLLSWIQNGREKGLFNDNDIDKFLDTLWIRKREFKELWNIDEETLRNELKKKTPISFVELYEEVLLGYDSTKTASLIVDKNPLYSEFIFKLSEVFPKAKFIAIVRDPRDRYVSLKKHKSEVFKNNIIRSAKWKSFYNKILEFKEQHSENLHILKFEDLITSPEVTLRSLCDYLEVDYSDQMMSYAKGSRMELKEGGEVFVSSVNEMHSNSHKPLQKSKIGQWKELSNEELKALAYFSLPTATEFDYSDFSSLSADDMRKLRSHYRFKLFKGKLIFWLKLQTYRLPFGIQRSLANRMRKKLMNEKFRK